MAGESRSFCEPIVLSTLPHFLAAYVAGVGWYGAVIAASSTLSVVWHMRGEPRDHWFYLDYAFAGLWTAFDVALALTLFGPTHLVTWTVCVLNAMAIGTNQLADALARRGQVRYERGHAAWHLFSAAKGVGVAWLLRR
jgi:hypothetical protein